MKKIFGMLLILCVFVCTLTFAFSVSAVSSLTQVDGVYQITSAEDLAYLSRTTNLWGEDFKLTNDITVTVGTTYDGNNMQGIGKIGTYFTGTFDGAKSDTENYTITYTYNSTSAQTALFGAARHGATFSNLNIVATVSSTNASGDAAGLLAFAMGGVTVENCNVTVNYISGTTNVGGVIGRYRAAQGASEAGSTGNVLTISDTHVKLATGGTGIASSGNNVGGVIGAIRVEDTAYGDVTVSISDVTNASPVTGAAAQTAGIVGYLYTGPSSSSDLTADITATNDTTATVTGNANQTGGIVGSFDLRGTGGKSITVSATNKADVIGYGTNVGGIAGRIAFENTTANANTGTDYTLTFDDCENSGAVQGTSQVGGIVGSALLNGKQVKSSSYNLDNCENTGTVKATANDGKAGGVIGYALVRSTADGNAITLTSCSNENTVEAQTMAGGVIGEIEIKDYALNNSVALANCTNTAAVTATTNYAGGLVGYHCVGSNAGNNNDLSVNGSNTGDITATGNYAGGMVGCVDIDGGDNNDISISGVDGDENTGNIKAASYAGGVVGAFEIASGAKNTVSIDTLSNNGTVTANGDYAGGIIGHLDIDNGTDTDINLTSCNSGTDSIITTNSKYAGGIIGCIDIVDDAAAQAGAVNVTVDGAENYSAVKSNDKTNGERFGGIVGATILRNKKDSTVTIKNSENYANFGTADAPFAQKNFGGILGYAIVNVRADGTEATDNTITLESCVNTGNMYGNATNGQFGGIIGSATYIANATVDGVEVFATPDASLGTLKNNEIKLLNCTNGAEGESSGIISSTGSKVGGIAGYLLARAYISENTFTLEGCKNYGAVTANKEAGGIVGRCHAQLYTDGITAAFDSCENYGAVETTSDGAGGILGYYAIEGSSAFAAEYNARNTKANFKSCKNSGSVESGGNGAAGIVAYVDVRTLGSGNKLNISGTTENSDTVEANNGAGGIVGYITFASIATTDFAADIAGCTNSGTVSAETQYAGGILGYFNVNLDNVKGVSLAVSGCNNKAKIGDNINKTTRVGGIVGFIGFNKTSARNCSASIIDCENAAPVMAKSEIGGIVGRIDVQAPYTDEASDPTLKIYRCRNTADAPITAGSTGGDYPESRAGGIIGIYYQQTTTGNFNTRVSECLNEGDIEGAGKYIGGIAGFFSTKYANKDKIVNCLNTGDIETTSTENPVGGIVGFGNQDKTGKAFTIENCYNAGAVNASNGDGVIGQAPSGGLTCTNVFCDPAVDSAPNAGSSKTKADAFTNYFKSVTAADGYAWVYSKERDLLELRYFHYKDANHSDPYVIVASGDNYDIVCESDNCGDSKGTLLGVSNIVYVDAVNGNTAENEVELANLGTKANPCKDLTLARDRVALFEDFFDEQTIKIVGEVPVPKDYHLPGIGHLTVTGDTGGTLYFASGSLFDNSHHMHIDGPTTIENIVIKAPDTKGVRIFADNNKLVMGNGISMVGPEGNNYDVNDYYGVEDVDVNATVGAKVYVFGGYSVNEYIHENFDAEQIAELDARCESLNAYLGTLPEGETGDSEHIINNYINPLIAAVPEVAEINSDITVRSGQYRAINGWSYDFFYKNINNSEGIMYSVPLSGTANITVGAGEGQTLEVTHFSPFGTDYQSYGNSCVANVTVDGDVTLYQFHLGAQVPPMGVRKDGVGEIIGESKYPLVINLHLDGNIKGTEDVIDDSLWGFSTGGSSDYAVLANITLNKEEIEAEKDAHAFLGHDSSYCEIEDCSAKAATIYTNFSHRSFILIDQCDGSCGGSTEYGAELYPTCITYGLKRKVCSDCGNLVDLELVEEVASEYHAYTASLTSIASLTAVANGVQLGDEDSKCKCGEPRDMVLESADGNFYVSETSGYDKYVPDLGSREKPFKDFLTAYRFAIAYADYAGGREATIVIIDKGTWTLGTSAIAPNRQFLAGEHMPGHITITSEDGDGILHFDNLSTQQSTDVSFTSDVTMEKMKITLENYTYENPTSGASGYSRIRLLARNNKFVMGEGLDIEVAEGVTDPLNYNLMVLGGFHSDPEISKRDPSRKDMYTDVTILSGKYYYIGAWNYDAWATYDKDGNVVKDGIVTGEGKLTIGDPDSTNEDVITTYYLSLYGVGAETTKDTKSVLHVYGNINVTTLEATAQNGIANGAGGSNAPAHADNRVSDIYVYDTAHFNVENVHINGEQIIGDYTVNVLVENPATNPSIDTVHMLCGHDKGEVNGEGRTNYRHINTFHQICTPEDCPYGQSDVNSYLFNSGTNAGEDCYISVNVYDMALYTEQGAPEINYSISAGTDSGVYYPGNIVANGPMGGVVRFLFELEATSTDCELDSDYAKDIVEESFIRYLFTNVSKDSEDNIAETSKSGTANHFRADVYDIPVDTHETYYAVGVVKLKDGTELYSDIIPAEVEWTNPVAYYSDVVEEV